MRLPAINEIAMPIEGITITALSETMSFLKCEIYRVTIIPCSLYPFYPRSPRGERHTWPNICFRLYLPFYPRSPRGERHVGSLTLQNIENIFLSTLSARRATQAARVPQGQQGLSIHALREESDYRGAKFPHYPCHLSIHALREESDNHTNTARSIQ